MELRHLRYFVAVAEELHFGRAAARLRIAQPPLSRQIRDLEREVGAPLFSRTKKRVALTAAGRAFLPEARLAIAQAKRAKRAALSAARGEMGELRLGFVEAATYSGVLPGVLRYFRKHLPEVGLELFEMSSFQQAEALRQGRIDLGILHSPPPDADRWLCVERVSEDGLVAALPRGHHLAGRSRLLLRALASEPFLLFPRYASMVLYDRIIAACRDAGFSPSVVQEAAQMQTIIGLVAAGMGIALVPASIVQLHRPGVVYRPVRDLTVDMGMWAVWKVDDTSMVRERFLSVVRETARSRHSARPRAHTRDERVVVERRRSSEDLSSETAVEA